MITRNLTYNQRVNNCYSDNREYLEKAMGAYVEMYKQFMADNHIRDDRKEYALFIDYVINEYVRRSIIEKDKPDNHKIARIINLVNNLQKHGYIDAFSDKTGLDGKLLAKPCKLAVDLTDTDQIRNFACGGKRPVEGLILPNGDFYEAKGNHYMLSNYLMLIGIDTSSAVRTTRMFCQNVIFSDMKGYCDNPAEVNLTEAQAKAMYNLYKLNASKSSSYYDTMMASVQTGFLDTKKPALYATNLDLLETTSRALVDPKQQRPNDVLNSRAFEQELRDEAVLNRFEKYIR